MTHNSLRAVLPSPIVRTVVVWGAQMKIVMQIAAALWLLQAASVLTQAVSAMHQILGCLYLSFGVLFLAAASIIAHVEALADKLAPPKATTKQQAVPPAAAKIPPPQSR